MLAGCLPAFCYKYIAYVYNGKLGYITNNTDLVTFMDKIDNLPEAILLATITENTYPDDSKKGGAYLITPTGFQLILTNYVLCPGSKQAIQLIISNDGTFKKIRRKIFERSGGCAVI